MSPGPVRDEVISRIAPAYKTDAIVRRENLDRYDDRLIVATNLIEAQAQVSEFAKRHLPDRFMLEGDRSVSPRDIIIRELVSNLMIHREFAGPHPARSLILGDGIHTENVSKAILRRRLALAGFKPVSRNPFIAKFLRNIGPADEPGGGMRDLYKYSKPCSGGDPMPGDGDVFEASVPVRWIDAGRGEQVNEQVDGLSERDRALLDALRADPSTTYARAAVLLGVSYATARRAFLSLRERGPVRREGSDRKGVWRVLE